MVAHKIPQEVLNFDVEKFLVVWVRQP